MKNKFQYGQGYKEPPFVETEEKQLLRFKTVIKNLHEDEEFFHVEGFASTFGNIDLGNDVIKIGAFDETLEKRRPKFLSQHDMSKPLGVIDETRTDDMGLFIKARMPKDLNLAKETFSLLSIGALDSFSIGFSVDEFEIRDDGVRVIKKLTLFEVSLVTIPMNPEARVANFKSKGDVSDIQTIRDLEKCLRDSGAFSKGAIDLITSRFEVKAGDPPDDDETKTGEDLEKTETEAKADAEVSKGIRTLTESIKNFIERK